MEKQENKKLRIIWNSNAPYSTSGYGTQMAEILPLIKQEGYPTAIIDFFGLEGGKIMLDGVQHYPKIQDTWGGDAMIAHGADFKADVTMTLQDIWVLSPEHMKMARRIICWVPIDHEPIPPAILERLRLCYRVMSPSPFAHRELLKEGIQSTYLPWTVNTNIFKKLDNKAEIRKGIGIPEDFFVFGMVSANKDNPPRKSFQEVMDAFKIFHEKHPKSCLYFHSIIDQPGGFPIREYARFIGINEFVYHPPAYAMLYKCSREDLAKVYNMMDCLLSPSLNEGGGIPVLEAQACEVPAIVNNFTAMRDTVIHGVTGFKTKVAYKRFTPLLSYVGIPDMMSIYEYMEKVYNADRIEMGKKGRKFIVDNFDTHTIFNTSWRPFLKMLQDEIYGT